MFNFKEYLINNQLNEGSSIVDEIEKIITEKIDKVFLGKRDKYRMVILKSDSGNAVNANEIESIQLGKKKDFSCYIQSPKYYVLTWGINGKLTVSRTDIGYKCILNLPKEFHFGPVLSVRENYTPKEAFDVLSGIQSLLKDLNKFTFNIEV